MADLVPSQISAQEDRPAARSSAEEGPAPPDAVRLAAEVARLEGELTVLRVRVAELETRAEHDPLTGILNRRGFERELARARSYVARYGGNAALVFLDLDGFKPVNDRHGHAAGDAVLVAVAAALVGAVRASDAVARLGGDEFAVLLWHLSVHDAQKKALALERLIADTRVRWDGDILAVGASAGVAELTQDGEARDVLAGADAAMYARKRQRKGANGE